MCGCLIGAITTAASNMGLHKSHSSTAVHKEFEEG